MNFKMTFYMIGQVLKFAAASLVLPIIVELIYLDGRSWTVTLPYIYTMLIVLVPAIALTVKQPEDRSIRTREGLVVVGLSWLLISICGALPFIFSGTIPNFVDALFESTSGFTTTGASIINDVEQLSKGILFWRCLMHFMGGMGVLMFMLAILPNVNAGFMHFIRFESTGTQPGKIVSRVRYTARILYVIYTLLMLLEFLILWIGGLDGFDAFTVALSTAGTGGFGNLNASIAGYGSLFAEITVTVFMFLFGINFTIFFLILIGRWREVVKSEEIRYYFLILLVCSLVIAALLVNTYGNFWTALRYSGFQVVSVATTTGFLTANITAWPAAAQVILVLLMCMGACAGSTGGGFKVSRMILLGKGAVATTRGIRSARAVAMVRMDGKSVNPLIINSVFGYFVIYIVIILLTTLLISVDGLDFASNITASISCINNVGPALGTLGAGNFAAYSWFSELILSLTMLAGRLEIFPILLLFNPKTWINR